MDGGLAVGAVGGWENDGGLGLGEPEDDDIEETANQRTENKGKERKRIHRCQAPFLGWMARQKYDSTRDSKVGGPRLVNRGAPSRLPPVLYRLLFSFASNSLLHCVEGGVGGF